MGIPGVWLGRVVVGINILSSYFAMTGIVRAMYVTNPVTDQGDPLTE